MPSSPFDASNYGSLNVTAANFGATINSAIALTKTDPLKGLGLAVYSSSALRTYLGSAATYPTALTGKIISADTALSSMSLLNKPYDVTSKFHSTLSFQGTLNSLASVAGIATTATSLLGSIGTIRSASAVISTAASTPLFSENDALGLSRQFGSPYLGSAASVFSLEKSYSQLAFGADGLIKLTSNWSIPPPSVLTVSTLHEGVTALSIASRKTWSALDQLKAPTIALAGDWLRRPATELYVATKVAAAISLPAAAQPAEDAELEAELSVSADRFEGRLHDLTPELVTIYRGGVEALERGGTDWQRHSMVSFRELGTHVLHLLAPDEAVRKFTTAPEHYHNGNPTRGARLGYIFSDVAEGAIVDFYRADMKAATELFDLLNSGTHTLGNKATAAQVRYLKGRLVGLLSSMLEARGY